MTQVPHANKGRNCPFNGKDQSEVCHTCPMWVQIKGKDPQSQEILDKWECAFALLPTLLIENAQQSHQTGAAVETFRNEMAKANRAHLMLTAKSIQHQQETMHARLNLTRG